MDPDAKTAAEQLQPGFGEFLREPAPNITRTVVDFKSSGLEEYDGLYAVILEGVLSPVECRMLVRFAEESTRAGSLDGTVQWERAMVNVGGGMQVMSEDTRKCGRIIMDSQDIVDRLWVRVKPHVSDLLELKNLPDVTGDGPAKRREVWKLTRLNERMRFLKYARGEYFKPHQDGMYETPDQKERTYYTLHLYLNENTDVEPLVGGATTFHSVRDDKTKVDVQPKMGSILIFQQRWLYHSGAEVVHGTKLTMRTELMYEKSDEVGPEFVSRSEQVSWVGGLEKKGKRTKIDWVKSKMGKK